MTDQKFVLDILIALTVSKIACWKVLVDEATTRRFWFFSSATRGINRALVS